MNSRETSSTVNRPTHSPSNPTLMGKKHLTPLYPTQPTYTVHQILLSSFFASPPTHLQILFFSYYFRWNELVSLFLITVNEAWPQNSSFIVRVDVDFLNSFVFFNFVVDPWLRSEEREILSSPRKWLLYANEIFVGLKKRLQPRNQNGNMKKEKLLHMMIPRMAPLSFSLGICFFSRFKHENSHWYLLSTHFVGAIFDKLIIHLLWVLIGTPSYKRCLKVEAQEKVVNCLSSIDALRNKKQA